MKCDFCGREVEEKTLECPYCHYRFKVDAQVLTPNERDTFEGITIEEDGSTADSGVKIKDNSKQENFNDTYTQQPKIKVHSFNLSSGLLMTLLILGGILALFFFLLPTLIVFAAVGAVVVFLMRLFM